MGTGMLPGPAGGKTLNLHLAISLLRDNTAGHGWSLNDRECVKNIPRVAKTLLDTDLPLLY